MSDGPPRDYDALRQALIARGPGLSRRLAQVARHFLNHPEEVAINTRVRLAEQSQVPPATITRFAREMGVKGFADLQAVFRERLLGPHLGGGTAPAVPDLDQPAHVFGGFVQAAMQSLVRIEAALDRAALDRFVEALARGQAVHVAAARGAFGLGAYCLYGLSNIGKRTHLVDNLGAMRMAQVGAMGRGDVMLAISFDDYTPETVEVARQARAAGHVICALTDNDLSPLVPLADHVLYVSEARLGHFRSQVPAMVVCQAVIVSLGRAMVAPLGE